MSSNPSGGGLVLWVRILGIVGCVSNAKTMAESCHDILRQAIGVIRSRFITCNHVAVFHEQLDVEKTWYPRPSSHFAVASFSSSILPVP